MRELPRRVVSAFAPGRSPIPTTKATRADRCYLLGGLSAVPAIAVRCSGAAVTEQFEACRGRIRLYVAVASSGRADAAHVAIVN